MLQIKNTSEDFRHLQCEYCLCEENWSGFKPIQADFQVFFLLFMASVQSQQPVKNPLSHLKRKKPVLIGMMYCFGLL